MLVAFSLTTFDRMLQLLRLSMLTLLLLVTQGVAAQDVHIVDNLDDDGVGSLRYSIRNAAPGDIIRIWVAGEITPDSTIFITQEISIQGPQPIHFLISGADLPVGTPMIEIDAGNSTVNIEDLAMSKPGNTGVGAMGAVKVAGGIANITHCTFEDCRGEYGAAIYVAGGLAKIKRCSFVGNQAVGGGAIYNAGDVVIENCAFHQNLAGDFGNAVFNDGSAELMHNTFSKNGTANSPTAAISSVSGTVVMTNNLLAENAGSGETNLESFGTNWTSSGGNVLETAPVNVLFFMPIGTDMISPTASSGLRSSIMRDGYGVQYYPIVDPSSDAIDISAIGLLLPEIDLRFGPREMLSINGGTLLADAGCIEFTPWMVTSLDGTGQVATPPNGSIGWAANGVNAGGQSTMVVFDLPGPNYAIWPTDQIWFSVKCNIDGYTQPGTNVPGPYDPVLGLPVTKANPKVSFDGSSCPDDGISIEGGLGSQVSGLSVYNFAIGSGITVKDFAAGCQVWGNHVGTDANGLQGLSNLAGIVSFGSSLNIFGGRRTWRRNVTCANDSAGIALASGSFLNSILGNFVGTDAYGANAIPNGYGVFVTDTSLLNLIGDTLEARNLISGNDGPGIAFNDSTDDINTVRSNWIGVDVTGLTALPNHIGVRIGKQVSLVSIGGSRPSHWNVISGNDSTGVYVGGSLNGIQGNLIGIAADGVSPLGNGSDGIYLTNARLSVIGGLTKGSLNLIGDNGGNGIKVEYTALASFRGNFIGTGIDIQGGLGNGGNGMLFGQGSSLCAIGNALNEVGNYIVDNDSSGIAIINSFGGHNVAWNVIGTDTTALIDFGNGGSGIYIEGNGIFVNTIGDSAENGAVNIIAYNGSDGITIIGSEGNRMHNNILLRNDGLGIDLDDDGVTLNDSLDTDAGANRLQNAPVITGAKSCINGTAIEGTFHGIANRPIFIEIYANSIADPSGYGEGGARLTTYLDSTDAAGNLSFSVFSNYILDVGTALSATATSFGLGGNQTSEFGANFATVAVDPPIMSADVIACDGDLADSIWATPVLGGQIYWAIDPFFSTIIGTGISIIPASSTGIYIYYATELTGSCASAIDSIIVTVNPLDDAAFEYLDFCEVETGAPSNVVNPGGTFDWNIDPQDGAFIDPNTGEITDAVGGSEYAIIYYTNGPCPTDFVATVNIYEAPFIDKVFTTDESCFGVGDGAITVVASGGQTPYAYSIDSGNTVQFNPTFTGLVAGTYVVAVAGADDCFDFQIVVVGSGATSTLFLSVGESICSGTEVQLSAVGNGTIWWSGLELDSTDVDPLVSPDSTTTYYATMTNGPCVFVDSVVITVLDAQACGFHIYNAFSPDGDGINDAWNIQGIENYPENEIAIFNRWGDPIHQFTGYNNADISWDGSNEGGESVPAGTYFYSIVLSGDEEEAYSGWVWVAR